MKIQTKGKKLLKFAFARKKFASVQQIKHLVMKQLVFQKQFMSKLLALFGIFRLLKS